VSRTTSGLLAAVLALGACATSSPPEPLVGEVGAERYFRVEWRTGQSARRGPVVEGSVYNSHGAIAGSVRVLVEGLDASGQVVSQTLGWVLGDVPIAGRSYFEVPVPGTAASYRVTVFSYEWRGRSGT
jgi:hypothetical protein